MPLFVPSRAFSRPGQLPLIPTALQPAGIPGDPRIRLQATELFMYMTPPVPGVGASNLLHIVSLSKCIVRSHIGKAKLTQWLPVVLGKVNRP